MKQKYKKVLQLASLFQSAGSHRGDSHPVASAKQNNKQHRYKPIDVCRRNRRFPALMPRLTVFIDTATCTDLLWQSSEKVASLKRTGQWEVGRGQPGVIYVLNATGDV